MTEYPLCAICRLESPGVAPRAVYFVKRHADGEIGEPRQWVPVCARCLRDWQIEHDDG